MVIKILNCAWNKKYTRINSRTQDAEELISDLVMESNQIE